MNSMTRRSWGEKQGPRTRRLPLLGITGLVLGALALGGWTAAALAQQPAPKGPPVSVLQADAADPLVYLLPTPPKQLPEAAPLVGEDLSAVPVVAFQEPLLKLSAEAFHQKTQQQAVKIKQLNWKEQDGFLKTLLAHRPDLAGLPVVMGDACQQKQTQREQFALGLDVLRAALKDSTTPNAASKNFPGQQSVTAPVDAAKFWQNYKQTWAKVTLSDIKPETHEHITRFHIGGLMQVLMPESAAMRQGLAQFLAVVPHPEATRALAQLAIFSPEKEVRLEALKGLKARGSQQGTDILLAGLKYPLPAVAQRAAEALVVLGRTDLTAHLVQLLDEPDPRLPIAKKVQGTEVLEAKQLVRLNHNQNCLLCHPTVDLSMPAGAITAPVPLPNQPLPTFASGYNQTAPTPSAPSLPDILVRVDVTYLRQDFSLVQHVPNAHPWPDQQRFDFLVRTVALTPAQAKTFQDKLQPKAGALTLYQEAYLTALRGLTGQNAAPTSQAWKKVLKL